MFLNPVLNRIESISLFKGFDSADILFKLRYYEHKKEQKNEENTQ
jgi:hypothetical protein